MTKKHILIEVLPRAGWAVQLFIMIFLEYRMDKPFWDLKEEIAYIILGVLVTVTAIGAFIWVVRHVGKAMVTKELITSGPYQYSRHPMYIAIYGLLIGLGLLFFSSTWFVLLVVFIPMWFLIAKAEESQMTDLYPEAYPEYTKKVRMFL